jgi:hypothetical protein
MEGATTVVPSAVVHGDRAAGNGPEFLSIAGRKMFRSPSHAADFYFWNFFRLHPPN